MSGVSPPVALHGFTNDIQTLERAVLERVFFVKVNGAFVPPPRPAPGHFSVVLQNTRNILVNYLPTTTPLNYQQFVDTFRGRKRVVYENARLSLLRHSLTRRDAQLKVFVKYEKVDFTRKIDPVPRVVSPRDPRYNVELGRFLRPIEEKIFRSLGRLFGMKTVMKGLDALQTGRCMYEKWHRFRNPVAVGLDASRFDQHVSLQALAWEHSVYLECFPVRYRRHLKRVLDMQLVNVCKGYCADGDLRYTVNGCRMSGDMNTSLGACLIVCCMLHAYANHVGVVVQVANNGDDVVVFMESADLLRFQNGLYAWFLAMGFDMKVEPPCYTLEEIEFCQSKPVWVGPAHSDYIMVRHPVYAIAKDTLCLNNYNTPKMISGWMHAVGEGGMSLAGGIPIFQEFYAMYLRYGRPWSGCGSVQSWGVRAAIGDLHRKFTPVHPRTRASFYWAYGIMPDEQRCIERYYASRRLGFVFSSLFSYARSLPF